MMSENERHPDTNRFSPELMKRDLFDSLLRIETEAGVLRRHLERTEDALAGYRSFIEKELGGKTSEKLEGSLSRFTGLIEELKSRTERFEILSSSYKKQATVVDALITAKNNPAETARIEEELQRVLAEHEKLYLEQE